MNMTKNKHIGQNRKDDRMLYSSYVYPSIIRFYACIFNYHEHVYIYTNKNIHVQRKSRGLFIENILAVK